MISFRTALLFSRYVGRAVHESNGTLRGLRNAVAEQIRLADATIAMLQTLEGYCSCSPRDLHPAFAMAQCPPCTLRQRVIYTMMNPAHHSSESHQRALDAAGDVLKAAGYTN